MKNALMIIIVVIAIAGILAFMVNFSEIVDYKNETTETTSVVVCEHITNTKCVCIFCGEMIHNYVTTVEATCTTSGTKTCSCGATQTISAYGHEWSYGDDCQMSAVCDDCGALGPVGPHVDYDGDRKCDLCDTSM